MAVRRKRRESRELTLSSRQSRAEIASKYLVVDGFVARQVVYSCARDARLPLEESGHLQQHNQAYTRRSHIWF